jgi:hypothetical protein
MEECAPLVGYIHGSHFDMPTHFHVENTIHETGSHTGAQGGRLFAHGGTRSYICQHDFAAAKRLVE